MIRIFFGNGFHLGKPSIFRNSHIKAYLIGHRNGLDIFDPNRTLAHLKKSLRFLNYSIKYNNVKHILFFSKNPRMGYYLKQFVKRPHGYLCSRWPVGMLQNWHKKVRVPIMNYFLISEFEQSGFKLNRQNKVYKGIIDIGSKPDLIIFMERPNISVLKDCSLRNVPCIVLSNRSSTTKYSTFLFPTNNNSNIIQTLFFSLVLEVLLYQE